MCATVFTVEYLHQQVTVVTANLQPDVVRAAVEVVQRDQ